MYAYIKGTIEDVAGDRVVIENGGIGYNVFVPASIVAELSRIGMEVKLYTYLSVKEDAMNLFGFLTKADLELFKMLITVNGIGPKGALGILGAMSADDLRFAIMSGDTKSISKAPGIGPKTAGKLVLELKDKFKIEDNWNDIGTNDGLSGDIPSGDIVNEAAMALTSLGYAQTEALRAIRQCDTENIDTVEDLIKEALKRMI